MEDWAEDTLKAEEVEEVTAWLKCEKGFALTATKVCGLPHLTLQVRCINKYDPKSEK